MTDRPFDFQPFPEDQPGGDEDFRPVRGIGIATMILLPLVCVVELLVSAQEWRAANLVVDVRDGVVSSVADLRDAASALTSGAVLTAGASLVAAIVFLVWLWRARINAERIAGRESQRHGRGWTIGGWFCPVVSLWFPYQIVRDVYAASSPGRPVRTTVVRAWWVTWLLDASIGNVVVRFSGSTDLVVELRILAALTTVSAIFAVAAAALAVTIIRRVNEWQELTPPTGNLAERPTGFEPLTF